MAKLKMIKAPKVPKLPRKPKASASLATKENWFKRVADVKKKYNAKVAEVNRENAKRKSANQKSEQLSKKIAGISGIGK